MNLRRKLLTALFIKITIFFCSAENLKLWYNEPAPDWNSALPVGNGFMGAMIYGNPLEEHIQFNESTLWKGGPHDYSTPNSHKHLDTVRSLLFEGQQKEAEQLANKELMSNPISQVPYQPFGDLKISSHNKAEVSNFRRELDLENAVSSVSYSQGGINYRREIIASNPDKSIIVKLSADKKESLSFTTNLTSAHKNSKYLSDADNIISLGGKMPKKHAIKYRKGKFHETESLSFHSLVHITTDGGTLKKTNNTITVEGADSATIHLVAATSHVNYQDISADPIKRCVKILTPLKNKEWNEIKTDHIQDYKTLFDRVSIDLGESKASALPTNERITNAQKTYDNSLVALVFNYGRYLMISCSREGGQPSNLQGIWNDRLNPSWNSSYTTNINTQMNYWPAEMTNLSECHEPLFSAIKELSESGAITAKNNYNCRGWVLHHNFDLWRGTAAANGANHGLWPTGGVWLCQHLWWRYEYHEDKEFLKKVYPILKGAAEFCVDYMITDPRNDKGYLISTPSHSPENGGLVAGPAMDHQMIRDLYRNVIKATKILNIDPDFRAILEETLPKIAPDQIGKHGQLQEWLEDKDNPKNTHRHVSHIWALHPGQEINWHNTPDLFKAAQQSLEFRGDESTGWSMGWKINFWARFLDGDRANLILKNLLKAPGQGRGAGGIYPNLLDAHPPFQIDGNFGATSGIAEMLMQNHIVLDDGSRLIHLLPALPKEWDKGSISGLKARGCLEIDLEWENHQATSVTILSHKDQTITVKYGEEMKKVELSNGKEITLSL